MPSPTLLVREYRNGRGLCMCGCGDPAPLAQRTSKAKGLRRGGPGRYVLGHQPRPEKPYWTVDPETGCWNWVRERNALGYGEWKERGERIGKAHRVLYERLVGPVPDGLELDHLCRNRACVNPAHLEPVTHYENVRRGDSPWGQNARKTHCKRGHPFAGDNLYITREGKRRCRRCKADFQAAWKRARRIK